MSVGAQTFVEALRDDDELQETVRNQGFREVTEAAEYDCTPQEVEEVVRDLLERDELPDHHIDDDEIQAGGGGSPYPTDGGCISLGCNVTAITACGSQC